VAQLATHAIASVTRIVEGVHRSVWDTLRIPGGDEPGLTRGITGLVYRSVHGGTRLVGAGLQAALTGLERLLEAVDSHKVDTAARDAALAVLNGVIGDHLTASDSPFAIPMSLRYRGKALDWRAPPAATEVTGKVLVLIHGLCVTDLERHAQYRNQPVDHGAVLATALGYSPVYVRYNSGLHTSQNGRELSARLERLVASWPVPIEGLTVEVRDERDEWIHVSLPNGLNGWLRRDTVGFV